MPSYMKSFIGSEKKEISGDKNSSGYNIYSNDDDDVNSNSFLNYNSNIGLKARLYQRNKKLVDRVVNNEKSKKENRDSLWDLLENYSDSNEK